MFAMLAGIAGYLAGALCILLTLAYIAAWCALRRQRAAHGPFSLDVFRRLTPDGSKLLETRGGLRLRCVCSDGKCASDAPLLLLVHGFMGCAETWQLITPLLTRAGFHTLAVDLMGSGYSDKPPSSAFDYTLRAQGDALCDLLDSLDVRDAIVVGHSAGGVVAAHVAATSKRVRGAVLIAPGLLRVKPAFLSYLFGPFLDFIVSKFAAADARERSFIRAHADPAAANPEILAAFKLPFELDARRTLDALAAGVKAYEPPYAELVPAMRVPACCVWAEHDKINPPTEAAKLAEIAAKAGGGERLSSVVLKSCGHYVQHEKAQELADEIAVFAKTL